MTTTDFNPDLMAEMQKGIPTTTACLAMTEGEGCRRLLRARLLQCPLAQLLCVPSTTSIAHRATCHRQFNCPPQYRLVLAHFHRYQIRPCRPDETPMPRSVLRPLLPMSSMHTKQDVREAVGQSAMDLQHRAATPQEAPPGLATATETTTDVRRIAGIHPKMLPDQDHQTDMSAGHQPRLSDYRLAAMTMSSTDGSDRLASMMVAEQRPFLTAFCDLLPEWVGKMWHHLPFPVLNLQKQSLHFCLHQRPAHPCHLRRLRRVKYL